MVVGASHRHVGPPCGARADEGESEFLWPRGLGMIGSSDAANVLRLVTLAARDDVEFDGLALLEVLEAATGDAGVVHEHICAALAGDEAVALLGIEKLDCACGHLILLSTHRVAG